MAKLFGGIEAGGTKVVCAVGLGPENLVAQVTIPTSLPGETLPRVIEFFREQQARHGELAALGIASFGPLDPSPGSPGYGRITSTPKPGWENFDLVGTIQRSLDLPVQFDTDVNGAALGEWRWGAGQGLNTFLYLTVGTGIGGGAIVNNALVHGMVHPDMGHIRIPHDWQADPFPGTCPYHGDCFEGLACGPALKKRWGEQPERLPQGHPAWELEAHYLALGLSNLICTLSPQRIVLGGGVMDQQHLFPLLRAEVIELLNGYVQTGEILTAIDSYIVAPGLGSQSGVLGAIALAELSLQRDR